MTQVVRVGDIAVQVRGVTYQKQDAVVDRREGYVPLLRAGNITDSGLDLGDLLYVPPGKVSERQVLQQGDVLIAASSGSLEVVGKAAKVNDPGHFTFGAFCKVLRPSSKVDPNYFAQFFKTPAYRRTVSALAAGANINNLRNGDLDNLEIPLPPIDEQRRIAAILDKADELRSKRRAALETLETLSQAIFIEMFGDPVTNPMGWPIVKFTEVAKIDRKGIPPEKIGSGTQYVGLENIVTGGNLIDVSPVQAGELASQKFHFSDQHVLYGKLRPYLCKIATPEFSGICSTDILPILPFNLMNRFFLASYLRLPRMIELATTLSSGANLPRLSPSALENFQVLAPPLPEQAQFACLVAKVREEIRLAVLAIVENDHLFESLQEKAFKGAL